MINNRLVRVLKKAKIEKKKLFCAYLTVGFPDLPATKLLVSVLEKSGADILELGFPFSDPLADGPTIQAASEQALRRGVRMKDALSLIHQLRQKGLKIPVIFFSYLNPLLHYGIERAACDLEQNGFDGLVIPDLSIEEGKPLETIFRRANLSLIYLIAPTTDKERICEIAKRSNGFIYYVSLRGVTGARRALPVDLVGKVKAIKKVTQKPVLVGFGVSNGPQARSIASVADGIIVGSAIVDQIRQSKNASRRVAKLVSHLVAAMNSSSRYHGQ